MKRQGLFSYDECWRLQKSDSDTGRCRIECGTEQQQHGTIFHPSHPSAHESEGMIRVGKTRRGELWEAGPPLGRTVGRLLGLERLDLGLDKWKCEHMLGKAVKQPLSAVDTGFKKCRDFVDNNLSIMETKASLNNDIVADRQRGQSVKLLSPSAAASRGVQGIYRA